MSFILDALKKLEQEKAARRNGNINISEEILRGNHRVQGKGKRSRAGIVAIAALTLVVVVAVVVAGALLWKREDIVRETEEVSVRRDIRREAPEYPEPSRPPAAAQAPESSPLPATAPLPRRSPREMESEPEKRPARNPLERTAAGRSGERFEESYEAGLPSAGADLKVSGIAWQEARSARRAVVNGVLVPEGTAVGGATVKKIFQNRVRFLSNGRTFDISISGPLLGDSAQPAPAHQSNKSDRPPLELLRNH